MPSLVGHVRNGEFYHRKHREILGIPTITHTSTISAINDTITESKGIAQIAIQSTHNEYHRNLTCLTVPTIADLIPAETFPRELINIPSNIKLADPEFHLPRPVNLLIGSGSTLALLSIGQINLSRKDHELYLQKTRLGWVIAGSTPINLPPKTAICGLTSLEDQVTRFWTIEEIIRDKPQSMEEIECEAHFTRTVSRNNNGRYTVSLPFRKSGKQLGESRNIALRRLKALERKLNADDTLKIEYSRIMEEYLRLEYMSLINDPEDDGYYMPHHAVIKESSTTTKVRVVFDASAKTSNGVSLNDVLMVGPTIQNKLFSHLIRFRAYKYIITADIEKMYLQVQLHENDRRYQRILWRRHEKIETFQLNTLAFGVSSSPFLATRVIQKLADDDRSAYPRAAKILESHLYVDDLLTGASSINEARTIRNEIIALLARGGFIIKQWASNDERVISDLAANAIHANLTFTSNDSVKTLGIAWSTRDDKIRYSTHTIKSDNKLTKRSILSEIAKIFDPLGLLGPVVLYAKKLMQDVWRCKLQWDESVPQGIYSEWMEFTRQLSLIDKISFDRNILVEECSDIQLHGFCDASNVGYGACLYVRSIGKYGNAVTKLLCAKSRVAPIKPVTIPRLELCGALLLARLHHEAREALGVIPIKTVFWCDSMIVLHWVKTPPHLLKTYIANRIAEIQDITDSIEWRHIRSEDNPADAISRGQSPRTFLQNHTWLNGPSWLIKDEIDWPNKDLETTEIPEMKKNTCLSTTHNSSDIFQKYSSYSKMLRIIAFCLRWRPTNKYSGPLCAREIIDAEVRLLRLAQATRFSEEFKELKKGTIKSKSKIINLNPFLDEEDLIRVGGRLKKSNLSFSQKHPILLPSRHHITDCIIREAHEKHFHAGIQTTLYLLRQRFWLLDGRNQVRKIIRTCIRCFRHTANTVEYKMGNLPQARVREALPFANCGIDFCGPFHIKEKKHRNRTRVKVYVCVFVCLSIKAVHLEVVSDLSTQGFLAALRRFTARRGLPREIYSDNGTNFVGANNQLKELYVLFNSEEHKNSVSRFASEHHITWHFIPPAAPHFGGLWESTVKLFKHHFKRVVGDSLFTFEELNTFTIEVEAILNSRPITSQSSDPNDLSALTPAHCLIGKPLTTLPEGDVMSVPDNRLSTWQHITKVRQDFWARWNIEYLNELQTRSKWTKDGPKLVTGTIVLIKDKTLPCTQWALGRITEIHPGDDGVVRAATVKTMTGEVKRSSKYLCPLPVEP